MIETYDLGSAPELVFEVFDDNDAPANATVAIEITKPDGTMLSPAPTIDNDVTGVYTTTFAPDASGLWAYDWTATGAVTTSKSGSFYVRPNARLNIYTTLAEMKGSLGIAADNFDDDDDLMDAILAASRAIDSHTERHFWQISEARSFPVPDAYCLELGPFCDLVSLTSLKTDNDGDGTFEVTWSPADYQLLTGDGTANVNAAPEPRPYEKIVATRGLTFPVWANTGYFGRPNRIEVTGLWGWPAVPDPVRRACRLLAAELFKLKDAPFGVAGVADIGVVRVRDNPKAMRLLTRYRKYPIKAA